MTIAASKLVRGRLTFVNALRTFLEGQNYVEVQTPLLHRRLAGFEKGVGFSTYSASLGERLWLRAAPELYLKRLIIEWGPKEASKLFEVALCLRDDFDEASPADSFDRPEFTLLELYTVDENYEQLELLLRDAINVGVEALRSVGVIPAAVSPLGTDDWKHVAFAESLKKVDQSFDLDALLASAGSGVVAKGTDGHAEGIEVRAADASLVAASERVLRKVADLTPYLRMGPQGYWFDFVERAFRQGVVPSFMGPTVIHSLPLESSPMAQSTDGVHCDKWELYIGGLRVALAQRELMDANAQAVRFRHLDHLRRQGYDVLPEPDKEFVEVLRKWPSGAPLVGMGIYIDRLIGLILGLVGPDGRGQEQMLPNVFKRYTETST